MRLDGTLSLFHHFSLPSLDVRRTTQRVAPRVSFLIHGLLRLATVHPCCTKGVELRAYGHQQWGGGRQGTVVTFRLAGTGSRRIFWDGRGAGEIELRFVPLSIILFFIYIPHYYPKCYYSSNSPPSLLLNAIIPASIIPSYPSLPISTSGITTSGIPTIPTMTAWYFHGTLAYVI
jgi:hypothetical protein